MADPGRTKRRYKITPPAVPNDPSHMPATEPKHEPAPTEQPAREPVPA